MKALVTGGAGFIGSHVVSSLLKQGIATTVLDDLSGGFKDNVPDGARFVEGSVLDSELVENLCAQNGFDYVFHLAAYAAEGLSHFIREFNYANNVVGSMTVINACVRHKVKCLVFTSSIAVYGSNQVPMLEDVVPTPEDPYGIAKYAVEMDLAAAHRLFGLNYLVFRPHNVYGEHQNIGDRYRNVIGIFMSQIMRGEPLTVFGDGEQQRAFSHVDDVAPVMVRAAMTPSCWNQVYNIGADVPYSVNQLIELIGQAFQTTPQVNYLPARDEVKVAYSSHDKLHRALACNSPVSFEEGIRRMATWARRHGPRKGAVFSNVEIRTHLPSVWADDLR
jgi:UDP-glucose 4-epimerase